jgi:hypothetical protein
LARASFWVVLLTGLLAAGVYGSFHVLRAPVLGEVLGVVVLLYGLLLVTGAWFGSQHELKDACFFLIPLSIALVLPDALAVQPLRVITFPNLGGYRIGPVPAYVAGLAVAPLLVVVWLAEIAHKRSAWLALVVAALAAAGAFAATEWAAVKLGLWVPRNVATWQGIALYAVAAGTLLGVAAWIMFVQVQSRLFVIKLAGAAAVAAFYAGALIGSAYLVQRVA